MKDVSKEKQTTEFIAWYTHMQQWRRTTAIQMTTMVASKAT